MRLPLSERGADAHTPFRRAARHLMQAEPRRSSSLIIDLLRRLHDVGAWSHYVRGYAKERESRAVATEIHVVASVYLTVYTTFRSHGTYSLPRRASSSSPCPLLMRSRTKKQSLSSTTTLSDETRMRRQGSSTRVSGSLFKCRVTNKTSEMHHKTV